MPLLLLLITPLYTFSPYVDTNETPHDSLHRQRSCQDFSPRPKKSPTGNHKYTPAQIIKTATINPKAKLPIPPMTTFPAPLVGVVVVEAEAEADAALEVVIATAAVSVEVVETVATVLVDIVAGDSVVVEATDTAMIADAEVEVVTAPATKEAEEEVVEEELEVDTSDPVPGGRRNSQRLSPVEHSMICEYQTTCGI